MALDLDTRRPALAIFSTGLVAFTGAAGFSQIGLTMNEWTTASLVVAALLLLVREVRQVKGLNAFRVFLAGVLSGSAVGFKLNAAVYPIALFLALVSCFRRTRGFPGAMLSLTGGNLLGFSATYGFWGVALWKRFSNPMFPFFNGFFKSEYWEPSKLSRWKLSKNHRSMSHAPLATGTARHDRERSEPARPQVGSLSRSCLHPGHFGFEASGTPR